MNSAATSGFVTFPIALRGKVVRGHRSRGILYGASRGRAQLCRSASDSVAPSRSSTAADTRSPHSSSSIADHGAFGNAGMHAQHLFDFERGHLEPAGLDDVDADAAEQPERTASSTARSPVRNQSPRPSTRSGRPERESTGDPVRFPPAAASTRETQLGPRTSSSPALPAGTSAPCSSTSRTSTPGSGDRQSRAAARRRPDSTTPCRSPSSHSARAACVL